jgi:hypothetical protein
MTERMTSARRVITFALVVSLALAAVAASDATPARAATGTQTITLASGTGTEFLNGATWQSATSICTNAAWAAPLSGSSYVGLPGSDCNTGFNEAQGVFRNSFQLPAGFQNASISVSWLADNSAQVLLNGVRIGGNVDDGTTVYFQTPTTTSSSDPLFLAGTNELTLQLHNWGFPGQPQYGPNPTGLDFVATITFTALPTTTAECKDDGWMSFGVFKNQGDCVSFVATEGKNQPR